MSVLSSRSGAFADSAIHTTQVRFLPRQKMVPLIYRKKMDISVRIYPFTVTIVISLRWHYPNQVTGRNQSQFPLSRLPVSSPFQYPYEICFHFSTISGVCPAFLIIFSDNLSGKTAENPLSDSAASSFSPYKKFTQISKSDALYFTAL